MARLIIGGTGGGGGGGGGGGSEITLGDYTFKIIPPDVENSLPGLFEGSVAGVRKFAVDGASNVIWGTGEPDNWGVEFITHKTVLPPPTEFDAGYDWFITDSEENWLYEFYMDGSIDPTNVASIWSANNFQITGGASQPDPKMTLQIGSSGAKIELTNEFFQFTRPIALFSSGGLNQAHITAENNNKLSIKDELGVPVQINVESLGTGTPSAALYLKGDGAWGIGPNETELENPAKRFGLIQDFVSFGGTTIPNLSTFTANGGAVTLLPGTAKRPGIIRLVPDVGLLSSERCGFTLSQDASVSTEVFFLDTASSDEVNLEWSMSIGQVYNASNQGGIYIGFIDQADAQPQNGVAVSYSYPADNNRFGLRSWVAGVESSVSISGTFPITFGSYNKYLMRITPSTGRTRLYINGNLFADYNFASLPTAGFTLGAFIVGGTSIGQTIDIDWMRLYTDYSSDR